MTPPPATASHDWSVGSTTATRFPVALLPNLPLSVYYNASTNPLSNPPGGANSDYTAADFQHMLLAARCRRLRPVQTLPSFHRPALVNYWINATVGADNNVGTTSGLHQRQDLCRKIMMRPIGSMNGITTSDNPDHPNFTGSNPNFDPDSTPDSCNAMGRGQRRRRGAGQRVGRSGDAGPLDHRRPVVQAAVRHPLRRSRRPARTSTPTARWPRPNTGYTGGVAKVPSGDAFAGSYGRLRHNYPTNCPAALASARPRSAPSMLLGGNATIYSQILTGATSGTATYEGRYGAVSGARQRSGHRPMMAEQVV